MPRLAYRDEYPWVRCSCGYILNHSTVECPNCGDETEIENVEFLDRFAPTVPCTVDGVEGLVVRHPTDVDGRTYKPVKYEDRYRRRF